MNVGLDAPIGGIVRLHIVMLVADASCSDKAVNATVHPTARMPERRPRKFI
jgi:hypothetical protein